ncbi:hypothetical protein [Laceyella sacchari]|jgi:hypothetical protein|uniref:Uncharacterized protein n=1 Tax=Laceyella sacchari TaxID=37482 RepID=A0ABY5U0Z2_LACSH|nr:hypothetical protein [Laceyella sacchari]UWE03327.1 hypothetical protein NYR52_14610 [Laceyella sacchari]UYO72948.1 hypothetical protein [Laceyella sacchari]
MYRILTGAIFCLISSILFTTRYIAAAILNTKVSVGSNFPIFLDFIGDELKIASFIALLIGVSYIILGEMELKKGIK